MIKRYFIRLLSSIFKKLLYGGFNLIYAEYRLKYNLSKTFRFNGLHIKFYGAGIIAVGENSYVGDFTTIQAVEGCRVEIGNNCQISHNVRIYTSSAIADQDFSSGAIEYHKNVVIEDFVWIGANVFINPGIHIGTNSIVGANSVVTRDIPPNCIVGGVPAKLIRVKSFLKAKEIDLLKREYPHFFK